MNVETTAPTGGLQTRADVHVHTCPDCEGAREVSMRACTYCTRRCISPCETVGDCETCDGTGVVEDPDCDCTEGA